MAHSQQVESTKNATLAAGKSGGVLTSSAELSQGILLRGSIDSKGDNYPGIDQYVLRSIAGSKSSSLLRLGFPSENSLSLTLIETAVDKTPAPHEEPSRPVHRTIGNEPAEQPLQGRDDWDEWIETVPDAPDVEMDVALLELLDERSLAGFEDILWNA